MKKLTVFLVGLMIVGLTLPARGEIKVSGFAQAQLINDESKTGKELYFTAKRARVIAKGDLGNKVGMFAQLEIATGDINVLDVIMDYDLVPGIAKVGIGRRTVPFGLQNPVSPYNLHTINYAQVVSGLLGTGWRELGLFVSGKFNIVDYIFAYVNGSETSTGGHILVAGNTEDNDVKDIAARIGVSIPTIAGLGAGVSIYSGKAGAAETKKNRTGVDVKYEKDAIYAQAEYITGKTGSIEATGYYLEAGYKVAIIQPMVRYDSYDPDTDIKDDEITIIALGANCYLGQNAKVQIFYESKDEKPSVDNNVLTVQTAIKF